MLKILLIYKFINPSKIFEINFYYGVGLGVGLGVGI